jgi:hypothetical protein
VGSCLHLHVQWRQLANRSTARSFHLMRQRQMHLVLPPTGKTWQAACPSGTLVSLSRVMNDKAAKDVIRCPDNPPMCAKIG